MKEMDQKLIFDILLPLFAKQKDYFYVTNGGHKATISISKQEVEFCYKIYNRFQKAAITDSLGKSAKYTKLIKAVNGYDYLFLTFQIPKKYRFAITQIDGGYFTELPTDIKNKITQFGYNQEVNNALLGISKP